MLEQMEQVHKATAVKSLSLQWLTLQTSCWLLLPGKGAVARGLNIQLDSTVCDYRLFVPRQCLSLPAVVDENKLELSLVFLRLRWGRDCRIGQAGCLTQRLPDCLLHSLYRCCGCYQLSQPKAKVLKELFRRRHLNIIDNQCHDQLSAAKAHFRTSWTPDVPVQQELPPGAPGSLLPVACTTVLCLARPLTERLPQNAAIAVLS